VKNCTLAILYVCCGLLLAGCPKGNTEFSQGRKAETLQDYDTALAHYLKALKQDPFNPEYKLKTDRMRFEASLFHVRQGQKLREKGDLQAALIEFQKAMAADPASPIAEQETRQTLELIASKTKASEPATAPPQPSAPLLAEAPPELKPLSRAAINLKMANDAKIIFETVAKIAGLTVIFDPDFPSRRITTELNNVTLEQALDIVSLQSKAIWKPVTENIILVAPDQAQKRRDLEEQVVRTFYMSNTVQPQDLTEIVTGLRQLLDLKRIQQLNAQNAIIIRATPDQLALAEKLINDIDKAKPEVVIQVEVLETTTERTRDLGILTGVSPGSSPTIGSVTFAPGGLPTSSSSSSSSSTTATSQTAVALNQLRHLSTADWSISLPSSVANALITDSATKIIQNPEIHTVDGQPAKLRIGNRIPVATGSIQTAGVAGVGAGVISPLLNTQFQYIDVGVNVDITPRIHPNHEVSMKVMVEVSTVAGQSNIGGINQPIIGQRKIEHDIRLKEGEANILGGLIQTSDTKTMKGLPALAKLPLFRYLFSDNTTDKTENEILIVLTPHIVRMPEWTQANLRPLSSGTETNIQVRRESDIQAPAVPSQPAIPPTAVPGGGPVAGISAAPTPETTPPAPGVEAAAAPARIRFEPQNVNLKPGQTTTVSLVLDNVKDLFSIPLMLQYNPAVISLDDVTHGGFLSGGTQEIAIVQRVDKEHGQAIISATRQPNTAGVSGSGTLLGLVIRAIAPGTSSLSVVQVNAHDSQQKAVPLVSGEATIRVEP